MEKISVKITGHSTQSSPDTGEDTIDFFAYGVLFLQEEGFSLQYEEQTESGFSGVKTILTKKEGHLFLERVGESRFSQEFRLHEEVSSVYHTPYGSFPTVVTTQKMEENLSAHGGEIYLEYFLQLQGGTSSKVIFQFCVTPKE